MALIDRMERVEPAARIERAEPAHPGVGMGARLKAALLTARRHGLARAAYRVALLATTRVAPIKILRGVVIETPRLEFLSCPEGYDAMFLPPDRLRAFARDTGSGLTRGFVEEAVTKGDECFGILAGDALAAYGWYASRPTRIDPPDLRLRFDDDYVYMYNGFTHPEHRGRRLHAIGMTMALEEYRRRGRRGLVSYVESDNFDSLRSCRRMGYTAFGSIYVVRLSGRYHARSSAGCRRFGFHVEPIRSGD